MFASAAVWLQGRLACRLENNAEVLLPAGAGDDFCSRSVWLSTSAPEPGSGGVVTT